MNASRYKYKYFQLWSIITLKPGFLIFSHGNDLNKLGRIQSYSRLFSLLDFLTERPTPRSNISIPTKARLDQGTGLNQWLFFRYSSISNQTKPPTGYCPRVKSQESRPHLELEHSHCKHLFWMAKTFKFCQSLATDMS